MGSLNHVEQPVDINQKQTSKTIGGDTHSKCPRLDSGNGSQEIYDVCPQNGEMGTQCSSRENEVSGDEQTNYLLSDKNSSSNCFGSSGLQQSGKKIKRQDHVYLSLSQDHVDIALSQNHGDTLLQNTLVIPLCGKDSSENQNVHLSTHLTGTLESAAGGINSRDDIPERNQDNISHSHLAVEANDNVQRLSHQLQPRASTELQNKCGVSRNSGPGQPHDTITRCLSAPTSSAKMSAHPLEFMSLPVSPIDLVPKHVMDNLGRELSRERYHVKLLQNENYQQHVTITKLIGINQAFDEQYNKDIHLCVEELKFQKQNVSFLKKNADTWKVKVDEKDKELSNAYQKIDTVSQRCAQLEDQICNLNEGLVAETSKNKILDDRVCNLERTLRKERARFERDDKCLREKIDKLKQTNKYMREGLEEHKDCPRFVKEYEPHQEIDLGYILSDQTRPKGVYPENNVHQTQQTFPKEKQNESSDYKTHHTSPKLEFTKSATQKSTPTPPDVKKCSHCYKEPSEFNSYKDFMDHIDKCEQ